MVIHWSFGNSLTHPLFAVKLLQGLQLLAALGTALAYLLYLMRSLFKNEAEQVLAERQPKDSQMGHTRLKRDVLKTLQDARHIWVTLAIGIAVTSLLYATLTTAGLAESASLLVAFSTLVGLILLNLLVDTRASSWNLLQAARTLLRKPTRSPEAEPLYRRALASCVLVLGAEHPDTAQSLNNLALLYAREGRYEQAEPLYQRALAICEKRLGAEHPHTRAVQANYARLLQKITDEQAQQPTPLNPKNTVVC